MNYIQIQSKYDWFVNMKLICLMLTPKKKEKKVGMLDFANNDSKPKSKIKK